MEIRKEVKDTIFDYIVRKSLKESLQEIPDKGAYDVEYEYELATNDKFNKYVFVVSKKISYKSHSLDEKGYNLYAFDVKSGKIVSDFEQKNGCYFGFFNDLKVIEQII